MKNENDTPLGWDSEIDQDGGGGFVTLPDNTVVEFEVVKLEKTRTKDGAKPMARLELDCQAIDGSGRTKVRENLVLSTACAWKLGQFFVCIGQRQHGESIKPNWAAVEGAFGRATLGVSEWTGRDGDQMSRNEIKQFLDPIVPEPAIEPSFG